MAAGGAAAAAAAVANAVKASGVLVRLEPGEFLKLLNRAQDPLVVVAEGGWLKPKYQYLFGYRGLAFFTKSPTPLPLPPQCVIVTAQSFWMPG